VARGGAEEDDPQARGGGGAALDGNDTSEGATAGEGAAAGGGATSGEGTVADGERRLVDERWPAWERPSSPCDTAPPVLQGLGEMGDWGCWLRPCGTGVCCGGSDWEWVGLRVKP